ncbi:hypothetical protein NQ176_g3333 [Zarea fungicola]|uniref:Uncharacterized protein n=1 Tax=Zarea fungicola TaxID=93591 RepID=A0ACC1NK82_9HYPO|nr:hypothetical protein NQ176_g3333 [Lecanicillium fungicola]
MALESMNVEYSDSLALGDMHHSMSADYLAGAVTDPDLELEFDFTGQSQTHEVDSVSQEQSVTLVGTSPESMHVSVDSIQLTQGLDGLIDDSVISRIVDGMINLPQKGTCIACVAKIRDHCFHSCTSDETQDLCRCPTMLNKLYLVVMDPKLSQSCKLLPLDLILFLEQALHNTVEAIKDCAICGDSTLSSANGITLCIAANWIVNSIQTALESEMAMLTSNKSALSLWSDPKRHAPVVSTSGGLPYINNLQASDLPPPSLDIRNSLRIGTWNASSNEWMLCVSEILVSRIKRMQRTLSLVEDANAASDPVSTTTTDRIKLDMAKDVQAKSKMLLGMVKIWVSECSLGQ